MSQNKLIPHTGSPLLFSGDVCLVGATIGTNERGWTIIPKWFALFAKGEADGRPYGQTPRKPVKFFNSDW